MIDYIERHETYIRELLTGHPEKETLAELLVYHDRQISWVQQERLAHLITMMFVCLFFLLAFGWTLIHFTLPYILLTALLLILSAAYILHYYRLENSVQRWYVLSNQIREKLLQAK
ncbi:MAG: hypothetical protein GYA67_09740 [Smithella sp.]|jgi:hypothetical protein|nr:hypothetical protein [Syntrophaceae bacterium]NMC91937.1 hypothetical protein [Smithella sp.]HNV56208.1 hypothetical protein [Smithellaceae bacterium]MBP8666974.1 hypothetical protein [Syntrophaceae bacterium]MBP9530793.1 hypothetical protein [Syntrophaceae bacterium]